jgi:putative ABC transport system permease protein
VKYLEPLERLTSNATLMLTLFQDLKYASRYLRKHLGFTTVAVLTIALGIGINTAMFTVFDALFLKPLPLRDSSRLVNLEGRDKHGQRSRLFSYLDYLDYRQQNASVCELIAWNKVSATLGEAPPGSANDFMLAEGYEYAFGEIVSTNYFDVLGARMYLGRGFTSSEDTDAGSSAIVLGHGYWQRHFNSDTSIVGKQIVLQGHSFTVIGVAEPGFIGTTPDSPSFWVPLSARDYLILNGGWAHQAWLTDRNVEAFTLLARIAPTVTDQQAQAAFQLTTERLGQAYPDENRKALITFERAGTFATLNEVFAALLFPLAIGFGLVLLVACANVANLLLARAIARQREIGVRLALGARRSRIIRQLLTESILLAVLGGAVGLLIGIWALRIVYPLILSSIPAAELAAGFKLDLFPDWRVFAFTLGIAALSGAIAGLAPAIQITRPNLVTALKDETSQGFMSRSRLRSGLVVAQIAVSLALLIAAGLLVVNAYRLPQLDTGMTTSKVFSIAVGIHTSDNQIDENKQNMWRRDLADRLRALPNVATVSEAYNTPLSGSMTTRMVMVNGDTPDHQREAGVNFVSAEYFQTLSIKLIRGRAFSSNEVRSSAPVLVVSETTANQFWPGQDPIGQQVTIQDQSDEPTKAAHYKQYEVIGVAGDTRSRRLWQKDGRFLYVPVTDAQSRYLLVQTRDNQLATMSLVRGIAASINPDLRASARRLDDSIKFQTLPFRAVGWVSGVLGSLALVLAALGLYGVTSFIVARRTHEIGIRMALGARARDVVSLFLRGGLRLTALGVVIGIGGGVALSRFLVSVLVDLSALSPMIFAMASLFLFIVATLTILAATSSATKVDPLVALRYE